MVRADCRYFPGDRPCEFHKQNLVTCDWCEHYATRGTTILVVKLDALGDVLRTTSVLPSLAAHYGRCYITWITSPAARELLAGNHLVDEIVSTGDDYLPMLLSRTFDIVINPDASARSCEIASIAKARTAFGYILSPEGFVVPLNDAAGLWLEMGGSDPAKRTNTRTYQGILHEICALDPAGQHIVLNLTPDEVESRSQLAQEIGIEPDRPVIAINTGASRRWRLKRWRTEGFVDLVDLILRGSDAQIVLLGGNLERARNAMIKSHFDRRVSNPDSGNLRRLIRTIDLSDVVVTGDTLALHAALGLKKRVVALFGPTSSAEIDVYGLGAKIVPDIECACCYRTDCNREPTCMDLIDARDVYRHVCRQVKLATPACVGDNDHSGGGVTSADEVCMVGEPIADW